MVPEKLSETYNLASSKMNIIHLPTAINSINLSYILSSQVKKFWLSGQAVPDHYSPYRALNWATGNLTVTAGPQPLRCRYQNRVLPQVYASRAEAPRFSNIYFFIIIFRMLQVNMTAAPYTSKNSLFGFTGSEKRHRVLAAD